MNQGANLGRPPVVSRVRAGARRPGARPGFPSVPGAFLAAGVAPFALRVTSTFRREDDAWKLVHRHADPISTPHADGPLRDSRDDRGPTADSLGLSRHSARSTSRGGIIARLPSCAQ